MKSTPTVLLGLGMSLLLAASATPEQKRAEAQAVFSNRGYVEECVRGLERRGVNASRAQMRQACSCSRREVMRHYGSAERMARDSTSNWNRVSNTVAKRCAAQLRR